MPASGVSTDATRQGKRVPPRQRPYEDHMLLPQQKLDALLARYSLLESELASPLSPDAYVKLSREFAELGPVVEAIKAFRAVAAEIADLDAMIADSKSDPEMRRLAETEKVALTARREHLEKQIRLALLPKDAMDDHN